MYKGKNEFCKDCKFSRPTENLKYICQNEGNVDSFLGIHQCHWVPSKFKPRLNNDNFPVENNTSKIEMSVVSLNEKSND